MELGIEYNRPLKAALGVTKRLNTYGIRKLVNIRKISNLGGVIVIVLEMTIVVKK